VCGLWLSVRAAAQRFRATLLLEAGLSAHAPAPLAEKAKLTADADYRANQAAAQRRWQERHPDYWRGYRERHPQAAQRNREQQRQRNRRRRSAYPGPASPAAFAKMDAYGGETPVPSGTYRLVPVTPAGVAKMDAYLVEMHVLSAA
jgi:hypothetical protein